MNKYNIEQSYQTVENIHNIREVTELIAIVLVVPQYNAAPSGLLLKVLFIGLATK